MARAKKKKIEEILECDHIGEGVEAFHAVKNFTLYKLCEDCYFDEFGKSAAIDILLQEVAEDTEIEDLLEHFPHFFDVLEKSEVVREHFIKAGITRYQFMQLELENQMRSIAKGE